MTLSGIGTSVPEYRAGVENSEDTNSEDTIHNSFRSNVGQDELHC